MEQPLTEARPLPRDEAGHLLSEFPANGKTYRWVSIDNVGILRWSIVTNLLDVLYSGFDSFQAMRDYMVETQKGVMPIEDPSEIKLYVFRREQTLLDNIVRKSENRYHLAMHICTLICLREGDDIRAYDKERAESYITDWAQEGYTHNDFLAVAGSLSKEFKTDFRQTQERLEQERLDAQAATAMM